MTQKLPSYSTVEGLLYDILVNLPANIEGAVSQATLVDILAKLSADPATQTTLATVLTKITANLAAVPTILVNGVDSLVSNYIPKVGDVIVITAGTKTITVVTFNILLNKYIVTAA